MIESARVEGGSARMVLAIVGDEEFSSRLNSKQNPSWVKRVFPTSATRTTELKGPLKITTCADLQKTIKRIERKGGVSDIYMLAHESVARIAFDIVSPAIRKLFIYQCRQTGNSESRGRLMVDSASKFCGTRLDEWPWTRDNGRWLYVAEEGVHLKFNNPNRIPGFSQSAWSLNPSMNDREAQEFRELLRQTEEASSTSWTDWWQKWKGPAAAVVGAVTTTAKITCALKGTAGGVFLNSTTVTWLGVNSTQIAAVGGSFAGVVTVAGPAVLLGAAAAAAVYFIPWKPFFKWLGSTIKWIFDGLKRLTQWFMSWWDSFQAWMARTFNPSTMKENLPSMPDATHRTRRKKNKRH